MRACIVMCDGQGLDDDDARVIAENLNKFKRLKRLNLVSWGRGREGWEGGEAVCVRLCGCCGWRVGWGCSVGCCRQGRVQPCDRCALQTGNRISRGLLRSMVEADARIVAPVVAATERGLVCNGRTFDFETCEDTGDDLQSKVRCKGRGEEGATNNQSYRTTGTRTY